MSISKNSQCGLVEDEEYYHGLLPREDVNLILINQGDFLIRLSEPAAGEAKALILSVCTQGAAKGQPAAAKHYKIEYMNTKYTIDGSISGNSVGELVDSYKINRKSVGPEPETVIKQAVTRASWELVHENIAIGAILGEGTFGSVNKGVLTLPGRNPLTVALKCAKTEEVSKEKICEMMKEARLMRNFDHPNVVKIYGVAVEKEPLLIVMEYVSGGDLRSFLQKEKTTKKERIQFIAHAAFGVEYLHSKNCIHRDLAARNCLMGKHNVVKISDFGLSREGSSYHIQTVRMIPIRWVAPEVLKSSTFSQKTDVWTFGVLMWEIYADGEEPYKGYTNPEVKEMLMKGETMPIPKDTPSDIAKLMKERCWELEAEKRASMTEIVKMMEKISSLHAPVVDFACVKKSSTNLTSKSLDKTAKGKRKKNKK